MSFTLAIVCVIFSMCKVEAKVENTAASQQRVGVVRDDKVGRAFANNSTIAPVMRMEAILNRTCAQQQDAESYNKARAAIGDMKNCFADLMLYTELPADINRNKPTGDLDSVFERYCAHAREKQKCAVNILSDLGNCLPSSRRASKNAIQNIVRVVLGFVCENDGDHIALFISEKGTDCIVDQADNIQQCLKSGLNLTSPHEDDENLIYDEDLIDESQPLLEIDNISLNNCRIAFGIRKCILQQLANCSSSTPTNVVEALLTLVQNATSCRNFTTCDWDPHDRSCNKETQTYEFRIFVSLIMLSFVFLCLFVTLRHTHR